MEPALIELDGPIVINASYRYTIDAIGVSWSASRITGRKWMLGIKFGSNSIHVFLCYLSKFSLEFHSAEDGRGKEQNSERNLQSGQDLLPFIQELTRWRKEETQPGTRDWVETDKGNKSTVWMFQEIGKAEIRSGRRNVGRFLWRGGIWAELWSLVET